MRALTSLALVFVLSSLPRLAEACAVCSVTDTEESRKAFIWTTVFMSVLPLGAIGAGVLWLRRAMLRSRDAERMAAARAAAPTR